jgi:hypothetical protein
MVKNGEPIKFDSLLTGTPQEVVLKINQAIIENNIKADKIGFEDVIVDNYTGEVELSNKAKQTKKAFEANQKFTSADILTSKEYKKENLVNDATIRIDLDNVNKVISSAKIRVKLDNTIKGLDDKVETIVNESELFTDVKDVQDGLDELEKCP